MRTSVSLAASMLISTLSMGMGWHIGISSAVFFAAMMPAMRAQAKTSPLGALPSAIMRSVSGCIVITDCACAMRCVTGFSPTFTMRAAPFSSKCVSCIISPPEKSILSVNIAYSRVCIKYLADWRLLYRLICIRGINKYTTAGRAFVVGNNALRSCASSQSTRVRNVFSIWESYDKIIYAVNPCNAVIVQAEDGARRLLS